MSELMEQQDGFTVQDDGQAEWCLKKILEAQADKRKWKQHYEAQLAKVNEAADSSIQYFTAKLEEYFESVPHKETKTQESYRLPSGKLVRKHQNPEYVTDNAALVPWLEQNFMNQLVKIEKKADWAGLKKVVQLTPDGLHVATDDGEIVPGVSVQQRPDVFKIEMEE